MSEGRKQRDSPGGYERRPMSRLSQNKPNRLSRSCRQSQQSPCFTLTNNCQKNVKTPKRHARTRLSNTDSPNYDSELQQDIIWDATSPVHIHKGKGAAKSCRNVGAVDISEIASRIAPKNEKPGVSESCLVQWFGDSAIPCTPEVRYARTRRKSTSLSNVEDLMKLAKQFDINMIQQDKQQAQEVTCADITNGPTAQEVVKSQDTLDDLFDGPTQLLSGRLSQPLSGSYPEVIGNDKVLQGSELPAAPGDFQDDWDDDLLDDSFVLELNLDPSIASAPRFCSTQIEVTEIKALEPSTSGHKNGGTRTTQKVQSRSTFRLESNPSVQRQDTVSDLNKHGLDVGASSRHPEPSSKGARRSALLNAVEVLDHHREVSDEDLNIIFASDSLWDVGEDDDNLLCQVCEHVEKLSQCETRQTPKQQHQQQQHQEHRDGGGPTNQRAALYRSNSAPVNNTNGTNPNNPKPSATTQTTKPPTGSVGKSGSFKRHLSDTVTFNGKVKCSAAEIEKKKQEALARRRMRMQSSQKLNNANT